jgi:hypothetical protein
MVMVKHFDGGDESLVTGDPSNTLNIIDRGGNILGPGGSPYPENTGGGNTYNDLVRDTTYTGPWTNTTHTIPGDSGGAPRGDGLVDENGNAFETNANAAATKEMYDEWMAANPGATDAEIAAAIDASGVEPEYLALILGVDPAAGREWFDANFVAPTPAAPAPADPILPGADTGEVSDPSILDSVTGAANTVGTKVGDVMDKVFAALGLPSPDYAVLQPKPGGNTGGTLVWGQPSGGVFGKIGTTPGGTTTGVQTGIPGLDILIGKAMDVLSGRVNAGDVLTTGTINEVLTNTAKDVFGIPDFNNIGDVVNAVGKVVLPTSLDERGSKVGIDWEGVFNRDGAQGVADVMTKTGTTVDTIASDTGRSVDEITKILHPDTVTVTKSPDTVPVTKSPTSVVIDGRPDEKDPVVTPPWEEPDPRVLPPEPPPPPPPPPPSDLGGFLSGGQGYRQVNKESGPKVDIKYLYDIGGDSIFAPMERDSEKDPVDALYAGYNDGGIVPGQSLEELIAFLENRRG